jgi:hypothetical protein
MLSVFKLYVVAVKCVIYDLKNVSQYALNVRCLFKNHSFKTLDNTNIITIITITFKLDKSLYANTRFLRYLPNLTVLTSFIRYTVDIRHFLGMRVQMFL